MSLFDDIQKSKAQSNPATSSGGMMNDLRSSGVKVNTYQQPIDFSTETAANTPLEKVLSGVKKGFGLVQKGMDYTGIPQAVGGAIGATGGLIGGAVGAVGTPIVNAIKGKPLLQNLGQNIKQTAKETAGFGYQTGKSAGESLPYMGLGTVPSAGLIAAQSLVTGEDLAKAIQSKDPVKYAEAGLGTINLLIGLKGATGKGTILNESVTTPMSKLNEKFQLNKSNSVVNNRAKAIFDIENNYAKTRKNMSYSNDANAASRKRIATVDIWNNAVNENGLVDTTKPGGAIDQYKALTLDKAENVVRNDLVREGSTIKPSVLTNILKNEVRNNNLIKGKALTTALNNIDSEVEAYARDNSGNIPLVEVHDAKLAANKMDWNTPGEIKTYQKSLAKGLQKAVEKQSNLPISETNKALAPYLKDIKLLESLNGRIVKGGKLGKYFAQLTGRAVGAGVGAAIGGVPGAIAGTVAGGEVASAIKGKALSSTFAGQSGKTLPQSEILKSAIERSKSPRLMLPAPTSEFRTQMPSGKTINLPERSQSTIDKAYLERLSKSQAMDVNKTTTISSNIKNVNKSTIPQAKDNVNTPFKTSSKIEGYSIGKEKTYQIVKDTGLESVKGRPVFLVKGIDTFLHKGDNGWIVSEASTGRYISESRSEGGAIAKADTIIGLKGEKEVRTAISKQLLENKNISKLTDTESSLIQEAKKYKSAEEFVKAQFAKKPEYGMSHRPNYEGMPPAYNLLKGETLPRDVYTHPDYSISSGRIRSGDKAANESWKAIQEIKNKPDAEINVYRAGKENKLNTGDWITFSKDYAKQSLEGTEKVYSFKVKAKDVIFAGDDINEFGYYPKSQLTDIWNKANKKPTSKITLKTKVNTKIKKK